MCDLPVVSTDIGDVAELLNGVTNSTVCQDTPKDLGAALIAILRSGERSDGREKRKHLKQSVIASRILKIYRYAGLSVTGS